MPHRLRFLVILLTYQQALTRLGSISRFRSTADLSNIGTILRLLGNPQNACKTVHIVGTNGKGSVAALTASVLRSCGFKTALFTSPFIIDFRERIQINGAMIEKQTFARLFEKVLLLAEENEILLTQFEIITAVAFCYFAESNCDYVIAEAGMGGRYDATNTVSQPLCTVITSISLDHTEVLGSTAAEIAAEKSGAIKRGVPVVTCSQPSGASEVIFSVAQKARCKLTVVEDDDIDVVRLDYGSVRFRYRGAEYTVALSGEHQAQNAAIALQALKILGISQDDSALVTGFLNVRHPARLEVLSQNPLVIIDGAHNLDGMRALTDYLKKMNWHGTVVFGAMRDKAVREMITELSRYCSKVVTVTVDNPRSMPADELAKIFNDCGVAATAAKTAKAALQICGGDNTLACGSLYLAAEIRREIDNNMSYNT